MSWPPGVAAPLIAHGYSFFILFREGLEAVLVVAAILGYLEASRNSRYRGSVLRASSPRSLRPS